MMRTITTKYYEHFKTKNIYLFLFFAKHSETQEELVVYQSMKTGKVWARPRAMFFGYSKDHDAEYRRFNPESDAVGDAFRKKYEEFWELDQ